MFKQAIMDMTKHLGQDKKRIKHIIGVFETSLKLAKIYHANEGEVGLASIYHDYHKNETLDFYESYLGKETFLKYQEYPVMYHALAGKKTLEIKYPHLSEDAYLAIGHHIFGHPKMSLTEKLVFVSDYCEPSRKFLDTTYIFELASKSIDEAVLYCMELTIEDLKNRQLDIHPDQYVALNYYKELNHGKS